jgi:hypothetical protein
MIDGKEALVEPVRARLSQLGQCGGDTGRGCEDFCMCEILPADGGARNTCLTNPGAVNAGNEYGYCYIDPLVPDPLNPGQTLGTDAMVSACPASQKRKLQFIGQNTPKKGSIAFIACLGSTITESGDSGL